MEKMFFNRLLGEFVKLKRIELNLSQSQLSDKMGLDYQYISKIERGLISPTFYWIIRLAESLELNPIEFSSQMLNYIQENQERH